MLDPLVAVADWPCANFWTNPAIIRFCLFKILLKVERIFFFRFGLSQTL